MFLSVDPLAEKYAGWSAYLYTMDNPVRLVDVDGRKVESPIFGKDGKFLEVDSDGYSEEIIVMDEYMYNISTYGGLKVLEHKRLMELVSQGVASKLNDAGLNARAFSTIYTHITKRFSDEIDFTRLDGGIINVVDTPIDEFGNMGNENGESYGRWLNLPINAQAGTRINADNTINVTTRLLAGQGQFTTVEYAQSVLAIHEFKGHGLNGIPEEFPAHSKAYKLEYDHKSTFNKLTLFQQEFIKKNAGVR